MVKILNPCGWEGAFRVLADFEPELRSKLKQTALIWPTTGGLAIISKPYTKGVGLLLQIVADQNLVQVGVKELHHNVLESDFSETVLKVSEEIVRRLLTNHCSKLGLASPIHSGRAFCFFGAVDNGPQK